MFGLVVKKGEFIGDGCLCVGGGGFEWEWGNGGYGGFWVGMCFLWLGCDGLGEVFGYLWLGLC